MLLALSRARLTEPSETCLQGRRSQRLNPGLEELLSFINEVEEMLSSVGGAS